MRVNRALCVVLGFLAIAIAAFTLRERGPGNVPWLPPCLLHRATGLHCPGCGMTRATHAALHGEWACAFRFNPLGMVLLPFVAVGIAFQVEGWVRARPARWQPHLGAYGGWVILAVVVGFWILRNLPGWPFSLLAPP